MTIEITEEGPSGLVAYSRISIAFQIREIVDIIEPADGRGQLMLSERSLACPYQKDYDALPGDSPVHWPQRFDLSNWGLFTARAGERSLGGAAVAFDTPGLEMLEGRSDLALLWDIRVAPEARGRGVGSALFRAAESWARARGCSVLKIETQNTNAPACRFYAKKGCVLRAIHRFAYKQLPHEIQMLWYKDLLPEAG
jgi:GNAT superfamily N-acetyltransferase